MDELLLRMYEDGLSVSPVSGMYYHGGLESVLNWKCAGI